MSHAETTVKRSAEIAFDQYLMWLKSYPLDFAGATAAAGDFIECESDLDELTQLIKNVQ